MTQPIPIIFMYIYLRFFTTLYLILFKVPSGEGVYPLHFIQAFIGP